MHLHKSHNGNFIIYFELLAVPLNSFLFFDTFYFAVGQSLICYSCQEFSFLRHFVGWFFFFTFSQQANCARVQRWTKIQSKPKSKACQTVCLLVKGTVSLFLKDRKEWENFTQRWKDRRRRRHSKNRNAKGYLIKCIFKALECPRIAPWLALLPHSKKPLFKYSLNTFAPPWCCLGEVESSDSLCNICLQLAEFRCVNLQRMLI